MKTTPFLLLLAIPALGQPALPIDLLEAKLKAQVQQIDTRYRGAIGVAAIDLTNGRTFEYNASTLFAAASTIKVPILVEMFHLAKSGEFHMTDQITIQPAESVGGSGHLQDQLRNGPVTLSWLELLTKMMVDSDNTATNRAIALARMDRVNRRALELGMRQTRLRRVMMDTDAAAKGNENITTPLEMARALESLYRNKAAAADDCRQMVEILKQVPGEIRKAVPREIDVAEKTGSLGGVFNEAAVVYLKDRPFIVSIYSSFLAEGENPVGEIAALFFRHYERLSRSNAYGNRVR